MIICLVLAVILSMDSLGIGLAYGMKNIRVSHKVRLIFSLASLILSAIAVELSSLVTALLIPQNITNIISALIFFVMGAYMLLSCIKEDMNYGDLDNSKNIDIKEALCIGIAVSLDSAAVGLGLGTSSAGRAVYLFPILIFIMQYIFLSIGIFAGGKVLNTKKIEKRWVTAFPGIILIILSILQLL